MPVTKSSEGEKYQVRPKLCKRIFIPSKSLGVPFCAPCNFHAFLGFMDPRCEESINWRQECCPLWHWRLHCFEEKQSFGPGETLFAFWAILAFWHFRRISQFFFRLPLSLPWWRLWSPTLAATLALGSTLSTWLLLLLLRFFTWLSLQGIYPLIWIGDIIIEYPNKKFVLKDCTMWLGPTSALSRDQNIFQTAGEITQLNISSFRSSLLA